MNTTVKQEDAFKGEIGNELPRSLLTTATDWIRDNLNPDQVFETAQLKKFVSAACQPDEVYTEDELKQWALDNGFVVAEKPKALDAYDYSVNDQKVFP